MLRKLNIIAGIIFYALISNAQDTLPKFSVVNKGHDRTLISWTNPYRDTIHQLSIQRSYDSLKGFKTILTLPDPAVPQNGYVDAQAPAPKMFYRLYIMLEGGRYLFSKSSRPTPDTAKVTTNIQNLIDKGNDPLVKDPAITNDLTKDQIKILEKSPSRIIYIKVKETFLAQIPENLLKKFRDSITYRTKDTLTLIPPDTILIKPYVPIEVFKASRYVYTEKDGNIKVNLPEADSKKYNVKFFEENGTSLFEIKHIKDSILTLDKTNFIHAGWFKFELYENGELKEKHKLFVPKDF